MSYEIFERRFRLAGPERRWWLWWVVREESHYEDAAFCTSPEAAEAARRLLSGECAGAKEPGIACIVPSRAKEPCVHLGGGEAECPDCSEYVGRKDGEASDADAAFEAGKEAGYAVGLADGAAQERARIVKWMCKVHTDRICETHVACLVKRIERGEHDK